MRLSVDRIHDHEELVVKPAAPAVMATGLYAGTTLADDGSPILLFDPAGIAEVGGVKLEAQERAARIAEGPAAAVSQGDAGAAVPRPRRRPPRASPRGRRPDRGSSGRQRSRRPPASFASSSATSILPLAGATRGRARRRQGPPVPPQRRRSTRSAMPSPKSSTSRRIDHEVIHAERPGEVSGVSLINGEPAELVDAHWLFANHVGAAARASRAAGLPPARRRSVDAEHAAADRRSRRLPRRRRRRRTRRPIVVIASHRRGAAGGREPTRRSGCAPSPRRPARRTTASIATTAPAC